MQNELIKRFVKETLRKIVMFALMMILVAALAQPVRLVVANELALGQMQASSGMFIAMETFSRLESLATAAYVGVIFWFAGKIACDTYKFVKNINTGKEKEN